MSYLQGNYNTKECRNCGRVNCPTKSRCLCGLSHRIEFRQGLILKRGIGKETVSVAYAVARRLLTIFSLTVIISRLVWFCFKALDWDKAPTSLQDVFEHWLPLEVHNYHINSVFGPWIHSIRASGGSAHNRMGSSGIFVWSCPPRLLII